jgi:hypothetical protein
VTGLSAELRAIEERATRLLGRLVRQRGHKPEPERPARTGGATGGTEQGLDLDQTKALLDRLQTGLGQGQRLRLDITWRIES